MGIGLPAHNCGSGRDTAFVFTLVDFFSWLSSGGDGIGGGGPRVGERGARVRLETDRLVFELLFLKIIMVLTYYCSDITSYFNASFY